MNKINYISHKKLSFSFSERFEQQQRSAVHSQRITATAALNQGRQKTALLLH